jgi:hypothetical protein
MGTYETSWFICAESLRLIISTHQQKGHEGKEDLGGYPEYKKTSAAASLGLARGQQPCKLQPPLATLLQIAASMCNTLANYSSSCYQILKH